MSEIKLIHGDCMEAMRGMRDREFELAIVDPPYGNQEMFNYRGHGKDNQRWFRPEALRNTKWDIAPEPIYFEELFRVTTNQIIWGGNFFTLPICKNPICWNKIRPNQKNVSEWEYAWTSFSGRARMFSYCANGGFILSEAKIHPTQKPVRLYQWLLLNYAKPGDHILDTHAGSFSLGIACDLMGYDCTAYEIDRDYFEAALARLKKHQSQGKLDL